MDMSEDCWEHAGLLQDVTAAAEPPPPPVAPDFLIQQQEVSPPFSSHADRFARQIRVRQDYPHARAPLLTEIWEHAFSTNALQKEPTKCISIHLSATGEEYLRREVRSA